MSQIIHTYIETFFFERSRILKLVGSKD